MSRDGYVTLPRGAMDLWICLRFVIVVFPDHTHYFGNPTTRHHCETLYRSENHNCESLCLVLILVSIFFPILKLIIMKFDN